MRQRGYRPGDDRCRSPTKRHLPRQRHSRPGWATPRSPLGRRMPRRRVLGNGAWPCRGVVRSGRLPGMCSCSGLWNCSSSQPPSACCEGRDCWRRRGGILICWANRGHECRNRTCSLPGSGPIRLLELSRRGGDHGARRNHTPAACRQGAHRQHPRSGPIDWVNGGPRTIEPPRGVSRRPLRWPRPEAPRRRRRGDRPWQGSRQLDGLERLPELRPVVRSLSLAPTIGPRRPANPPPLWAQCVIAVLLEITR